VTSWFDASIRLQKQWLDAQRTALDAGTRANAAGAVLVQAQEATRRAADANLAAWQAWMRLWGVGPW